ncbi:MAG: glycosyltransferase family 4 protein [Dehalococcoidia bacterium]
MKVILACCGTSHYYGFPKYFYLLAKYLAKQGIEVELVIDSEKGREKVKEVCGNVNTTIIRPSTGVGVNFLRRSLYSINVARYLRDKNFDILHTGGTIPFAYLHAKNRAPTVFQAFGNESFTHLNVLQMSSPMQMFYRLLAQPTWKYCGSHADVIAAEGEFQIEEMMEVYAVSRDKIFILPVGIDSAFIKQALDIRTVSREELGLTASDFTLLSVNTLDVVKGINYLIDAFYLVRQKLANARLIIIGAGPEETNIYNQIKAYQLADSIIHLKNVPEATLYDYYALSDLFVSPTLQKDFIMGILEAEVCGLPIVSTGQDWLIREGENGYVVPQKDPAAMADAILKIYKGNRKTMGIASQKIAREYDFEAITKLAIKQYQKMLSQRNI